MRIFELVRAVLFTRKSELATDEQFEEAARAYFPDHHGLGSVVGDARKNLLSPHGGIDGLTPEEEAEATAIAHGCGHGCEACGS